MRLPWSSSALAGALLGAAGLLAVGCSGGGGSRSGPPNILLVSLDTLRADRLGAYGYERPTSPGIDALAEEGAVFENAIAESSWTLPSHVSMMSGLYPATHKVGGPKRKPRESLRFLAQFLQEAGYATLAVTGGGFLSDIYGFGRGFERFAEEEDSLERTLELAEGMLDQRAPDRPWFLFVHTFEIHCPYFPPEEYGSMFSSPDAVYISTKDKCGNPDYNNLNLDAGRVRHISDQYDGSIRYTDELLCAFLERLRERDLLENTVVVITSDHGEEFFEHGQIGHERTLYIESLRVPLIVVGPSVKSRRHALPVGLVDLAPTLLELAGLESPEGMEGRSLVDYLRGEKSKFVGDFNDDEEWWRFSELRWKRRLQSVWSPRRHLILDVDTGESLLFDLKNDPLETRNLREDEQVVAELLEWMLREHLRQRQGTSETSEAIGEIPAEERERLNALGYGG